MAEKKADFQSIRDSFEMRWDGVPYQKGKGYKQFRRWEWFMEQRMYPSGDYFNPMAAWEEWEKIKKTGVVSQEKSQGDWTPLGPDNWTNTDGWNPGNGRINVIAQDPNDPNTIYIGAASGGLWKSVDGGESWDNLTDNQAVLGVSGIAVNPNNSNVIYIGTGDGDGFDTYSVGVLKSVDGGLNWSTTGLNWTVYDGRAVRQLLLHPANPDILFAATSAGLFKTTNGGDAWTLVQSGNMQGVEFHPGNPEIVYSCSDKFFRSTNGGSNFLEITSGLPGSSTVNRFKIAVSANQPDWVYVLAGKATDSTFKGLYHSGNSGASFVTKTETPNMFGYDQYGNDDAGQSWYDMAIAVNPTNANEIFIGGVNIWKSGDGGSNFSINTQWYFPNSIGYVHADIHALAYFGNRLYCGSDGGIYKTDNNGTNWQNLTNGISIMQFYDIAIAPTNPDLILAGAQDNGTNLYNGSSTWAHVIGADGMVANINPQNPDIMYGAVQYGDIFRSTNGGNTFSSIVGTNDFGESAAWVAPYVLSPNDPNTIYLGYRSVYKSVNGGDTWTALNSVGNSDVINNIAVAASNTNVIYVSKYEKIYQTQNGGNSWTNITAGLPNLYMTDIAVDPNDANRLWVTFSGYSSGSKIYQSNDGGAHWTNLSYSLPNLPANCVTFDFFEEQLYIGMDVGIFSKQIDDNGWTPNVAGLPNVIINDLEINFINRKIYAGSFGRGVWVADLNDDGTYIAINGNLNINEGDSGPSPFTFTVMRMGDIANGSLVSWSVAGSGTNPADAEDFTGGVFPSGTVSFPPGSSAPQTITVNVNGDTDLEPNEEFTVSLFDPVNASVTSGTAIGIILNDDVGTGCYAPYCTAGQSLGSCGSGDEFISNVTFNTIDNSSSCSESLPSGYTDYTNIGTTLMAGATYTLSVTNGGPYSSGDKCRAWFDWNGDGDFSDTGEQFILTGSGIGNGQFFTISITVPNDVTVSSTRMRVRVTYGSNPTPCGSSNYGETEDYCISIISIPDIAISGNPTLNEGDSGSAPFTFTVSRTGYLADQSAVNWAVAGSGADPADEDDFTGGVFPSGTLTLPPGSSASQTITVNVNGDTDFEPDEGFTVALYNPVNADIAQANASGTILNDDPVPIPDIAISGNPVINEGDSGSAPFTFTVSRTGYLVDQSAVNWAVAGSGADPADEDDFTGGVFPSGTLTFPPGSSASQTITVNVNGDTDFEPDEGFTVALYNPVNADIAQANASGTILNDDPVPIPEIAISGNPVINEGDSGSAPFTFTVSRTGYLVDQSAVNWAVAGSGADPADEDDFTGGVFPSGTLTFPSGSSASQTITVNVNGDTDFEPDEGFTVALYNPVNADIVTATANGLILNDDDSSCPDERDITGAIQSDTYQAALEITSDGAISIGNIVIFKAGNGIKLQPGFEVKLGAVFEALIEVCTPFKPVISKDK